MAQASRRAGTVVVGGGTGFIGASLGAKLRSCGYDVVNVSRKPGPYRMSWGDITTSGLPAGTTAVVSLAGANVLDPLRRWTASFQQEVRASRVNTTRSLAAAAADAVSANNNSGGSGSANAPAVFVSMSGVGFYKPSRTATYTEESAGGDFDFLSRLCTEWEAASTAATQAGIRTVTVRSGVVLGRHGGMIQQLFLPFYLGVGGPIGSGEQYFPWIHIDDIVRLIVHAIENPKTSGILNGVTPQPITNAEFSSAFASALSRPGIIPLPSPVVRLLFGEDRATMMLDGQRVLPERTLASGFKYRYPTIDEACTEFARLQYKPVEPF